MVEPGQMEVKAACGCIEGICQALEKFHLRDTVGVEVVEGKIGRLGSNPEPFAAAPTMSFADTFSQTLRIGASVGYTATGSATTTTTTTGSLGYFFESVRFHEGRMTGAPITLAMTAHHVVAPDTPAAIHFQSDTERAIDSPSLDDQQQWKQQYLTRASALLDAPQVVPDASRQGQRQLFGNNDLTADNTTAQQRLQIATSFHTGIGSVLVSSGRYCTAANPENEGKPVRLNWAAVHLTGPRAVGPMPASNSLIDFASSLNLDSCNAINAKLVFKLGRTTAATVGQSHGFHTVYHFVNPNPDRGVTTATRKWATTHEMTVVGFKTQKVFAAAGDSGALVWSATSNPLGMIWGGVDPGKPSAGNVFKFDVAGEDIAPDIGLIVCYTPLHVVRQSLEDALSKNEDGGGYWRTVPVRSSDGSLN